MEPKEFMSILFKVLAIGFFLAAIRGAESDDPIKTMPMLFTVIITIVLVVACIGILCYVFAWAWRNPWLVIMTVTGALYLWHRWKQGQVAVKA